MRKLLAISCFVFGSLSLFSQSAPHKIKVVARSYGDSVVLRWAPSSAVAWEAANKHGFYVERYVIMKDSVLQERPQNLLLTNKAIHPWPVDKWKSLVENNPFGALAAQALYGKTFQLSTGSTGNDITQIYQKVKESEARYSLALFAADISREVSIASGLRFTDKAVRKGERYLYRVYTNSSKIKIDTGFCYVRPDEQIPLPKPTDIQAHVSKGITTLTWNKNYFSDIYTAYFVERSNDGGKTFQTLNDLPLVSTYSGNQAPDRAIYTDSIPQVGKQFLYRVRGVNAFAEQGPPSDFVEVVALPEAEATPEITDVTPLNNTEVHLKWNYPQEHQSKIKEFNVERASKASGPYKTIAALPVTARSYVDKNPLSNSYYRVKAIGVDKSELRSLPHLAQLIDSVAPSRPVRLAGTVDSLGIVKLNWKKNTEIDLKGYRVYRANFANDEFSQVTRTTISDTVFYDTIQMKTLTKSVFYKVVAVDNNFNPSDFSELLKIERIDLVPPTAPLFTKYQSTEEGVLLHWRNSTSEDVKETILYRRLKGEKTWVTVATFPSQETRQEYFDKQTSKQDTYEYLLRARDTAGLQSSDKNIVSAKRFDDGIREPVSQFKGEPDRKNKQIVLSWQYPGEQVLKFQIYKKSPDGELVLFKTLSGTARSFADSNLKINTSYAYAIKALWRDGGESAMSEKITILY